MKEMALMSIFYIMIKFPNDPVNQYRVTMLIKNCKYLQNVLNIGTLIKILKCNPSQTYSNNHYCYKVIVFNVLTKTHQ